MAQQAWVRAYREGIQAFEKGNLALAETKLKEAKEKGPRQGRRVAFSSLDFEAFIPDYYLGLIAARNGRHADAVDILERVLSDGLVTQGQRNEYAEATGALTKARALARGPDPPPPQPVWQAEFQRAMYAAEQALKARRYADARTSANTARANAKDARAQGELAALERRIRSEEGAEYVANARQAIAKRNESEAQAQIQRLVAVDPQNPAIDQLKNEVAELRKGGEADLVAGRARTALDGRNAPAASQEIARLAAINPQHPALAGLRGDLSALETSLRNAAATTAAAEAQRRRSTAEREAILLYFRGDYSGARSRLQAFSETPSPRMHLYLACSQAALALLNKDANLAAEARRTYSRAQSGGGQFTTDLRYISPAIVKVLNAGTL
jgi:hypothetical protein